MSDSDNRDALLQLICRLAEGTARPVLKKAVSDWLDQAYWAIRHAVEQREKCLPASPFPLNEHSATFPGACAALAVLHEKTEPFYLLRPDLRDGSYRHFAWRELCKDVEDLSPRHIRSLLGYVRAELQNRGVALPSDEESTSRAAEGDVATEVGTPQTESTAAGPEAAWLRDFLKKIHGEMARMAGAMEKAAADEPPSGQTTPKSITEDESEGEFLWHPPMLEGYVFDLLKEVEYPTERAAVEWIAKRSRKPQPSRATLRKTYAWRNRPQKTPKPRTTNEAQSGVSPAENADAAVSHEEVTNAVLDIEEKLQRQLAEDEREAVAWTLQQAGEDEEKRDEAIRQLIAGFRSSDM